MLSSNNLGKQMSMMICASIVLTEVFDLMFFQKYAKSHLLVLQWSIMYIRSYVVLVLLHNCLIFAFIYIYISFVIKNIDKIDQFCHVCSSI